MNLAILRRIPAFCLAITLAFLGTQHVFAEGAETETKDLTRHMRIEQSTGHSNAAQQMRDDDLSETFRYLPYEQIRLTWEQSPAKPGYLCVQWGVLPERVRIRQYSADSTILSDAYADAVYDGIFPLSDNTSSVTVTAGPSGMDFARIVLFSEGTLPAPFFPWKETPKGDYLIVSTHPDDDVLFMGGIIPLYGAEQGYTGTVVYVTSPSRKRVNEANLRPREMGAEYRPFFLGFQDIGQPVKDNYLNRFSAGDRDTGICPDASGIRSARSVFTRSER